MPKFTQQSRETLHDFGFYSIVKNTILEESTNTEFQRLNVAHIGAVAILPYYDNGDVVIIEQYRSTINGMSMEVVAGRRDVDGEDPLDCARRELKEEVGVTAEVITPLGFTYSSPGISDEKLFLYLAQDCSEMEPNEPHGIEEEFAVPHRIALTEALEMACDGRIVDAKSIVALFRAAHHLGVPS